MINFKNIKGGILLLRKAKCYRFFTSSFSDTKNQLWGWKNWLNNERQKNRMPNFLSLLLFSFSFFWLQKVGCDEKTRLPLKRLKIIFHLSLMLVCGCSTGAERSACPPEVAGLNPSWFSVLLIIYLRILKQAEKDWFSLKISCLPEQLCGKTCFIENLSEFLEVKMNWSHPSCQASY